MAPGAYRTGGTHARIGYALGNCPLGRILIAATPRGLCAVMMGDDHAALVRALREQFTRAEVVADTELDSMLARVVGEFAEHPATLDLPLDLRATAFQMRVWEALRRIPRGETRSYAELARSLGQPTATRAVARACATNPVAVVVPCHRVIGSNGKLTGYRWGVERKKQLLAMEKATNQG
jgi:AraC family transcriptional regulator of adaptative response/methylated-DNA-[protein]-cysteine methyltransferase